MRFVPDRVDTVPRGKARRLDLLQVLGGIVPGPQLRERPRLGHVSDIVIVCRLVGRLPGRRIDRIGAGQHKIGQQD